MATNNINQVHISVGGLKEEKITKAHSKLVAQHNNQDTKQSAAQRPPKTLTPKQERRNAAVSQAREWVCKIMESEKVHNAATEAIESIFDTSPSSSNHAELDRFSKLITDNGFAENMSTLVSLKEHDHVYAHSIDVGVIFQSHYFKLIKMMGKTTPFCNSQEALLGATLHDFGKSLIPKEIFTDVSQFEQNSLEMKLIQSHPTYGAKLLSDMDFSEAIVNMAYLHHVKPDSCMPNSYPKKIPFSMVQMEGRLLSIIDIYQALVGKRPFQKSWSPSEAIRYLDALAGLEIDADLFEIFVQVIGKYPKGSLVELNDGSLGFVLSVPEKDLERPQVIVVRNGDGEDLEHATLVDLKEELDLSIVKDRNSFQVFGKDVFQRFVNMQII